MARSMKLFWLLTISIRCHFNSSTLHWFLINMFLHVGVSLSAHWCAFHASMGESECCISLWCLAAQTVAARHLSSSCWRLWLNFQHTTSRVRKSTELVRHKTPDFTPDMTWPPNNQTSIWTVIEECVYQKQEGMSNIVDELWLLTEWYISQGRVLQWHVTQISRLRYYSTWNGSKAIQDRAIVTMADCHSHAHVLASNWPLLSVHDSKSYGSIEWRHYLTLDISETVRDTDIQWNTNRDLCDCFHRRVGVLCLSMRHLRCQG